jgi:hydrogenase-1 operon protein HyaE
MSPLVRRLFEHHGLPLVDELTLDAFLDGNPGEPKHSVLFFSGDGAPRAETTDVAVVLPELLSYFFGRLRGAMIVPEAEGKLRARLHAHVSPSLVVMRERDPVGVLPKICDWAEYVAKIEAFLDPAAPVLEEPNRPRVDITFSRGAASL